MYANILIPTDGSELATKGVREGFKIAAAFGARVVILTATDPWPITLGVANAAILAEWENGAAQAARQILEDAAKIASEAGVECETTYIPNALPAEAITEYAKGHNIDLIIMASHGRRGLRRMMLGSQASEVLARSSVPVLIVK